jgi:hypothetical protein
MALDLGERKPIVICDRGYPSKDFVKYLQDKEIKYVMRVPKRYNSRIDKKRSGSKVIKLSEGVTIRAIVFRLGNGERETLITNLEDGEMEDAAFADLYYKRWPHRNKIQPGKTETGTGELQRVAGGQYQAGFLRDDDGVEYAFPCFEGSE